MKFRKKPVVIEAILHLGDNIEELLDFMGVVERANAITDTIIIRTLAGDMRCNKGDWIIKGIKGELYPVRDEIFQLTYEPAYPLL